MYKLLVSLCCISVVVFTACKKEDDDDNNNNTPAEQWKITYNIGCTDCQVIYYSDSLENQLSEDHRNSAWSYTFYGKKNQTALLFAYNTSSNPQGVTATIMLNDTVLETRTTFCPVSGYAFVVDTLR